jgi:hypothetical protein
LAKIGGSLEGVREREFKQCALIGSRRLDTGLLVTGRVLWSNLKETLLIAKPITARLEVLLANQSSSLELDTTRALGVSLARVWSCNMSCDGDEPHRFQSLCSLSVSGFGFRFE